MLAVVRASFKPEFLNRLDEVVLFDALTKEELAQDRRPAARAARAAAGRPPDHDHRSPTRRASGSPTPATTRRTAPARCSRLIQSAIGDPLSKMLIAGEVVDGGSVTVDKGEDGLTLTV